MKPPFRVTAQCCRCLRWFQMREQVDSAGLCFWCAQELARRQDEVPAAIARENYDV